MTARLPLPTLLSYLLVAFTVEFDNEAEHRLPHRTTTGSSTTDSLHAPWFVSLVMWFNCMRFVDEKGLTAREMEQAAGTKTNLNGMERWGYVVIEPDPAFGQIKTPRSQWLIRPTRAGRNARQIWQPLFAVIEDRWRQRFGEAEIDLIKKSMRALIDPMHLDLPDCLPILGYGLFSREKNVQPRKEAGRPQDTASELPLPSLLSKLLLAFAIEFELESEVSLAVGANVLRLVDPEGRRLRDIPRLAGVSKEAIAMAVNFLRKRGFALVKPESPGSRINMLLLTPKGQRARNRYIDLLSVIEERWRTRYGEEGVSTLRNSLESLVSEPAALFRALTPYPDGWRASRPRPVVLPHYPMVLHRGGFPDGS